MATKKPKRRIEAVRSGRMSPTDKGGTSWHLPRGGPATGKTTIKGYDKEGRAYGTTPSGVKAKGKRKSKRHNPRFSK